MKKSTAKRNFIAIAVVVVVALVLTVLSFNIPFTRYTYNGFIGGMPLGSDLGESIVATYSTSQNEEYSTNYKKDVEKVITEFNSYLQQTYNEFFVNKNENSIMVRVPNVGDVAKALEKISGAGSIEFKTEESVSADAYLSGKHIESAAYANNEGTPGILITFTDEGEDLFFNLTTEQKGKSIYIYIGEEMFFNPTVSDAISGGVTFISSESEAMAKATAFKITASLSGVNMVLNGDIATLQPSLGEHTVIYLAILGALLFAGVLAFFSLKFKHLGLIASMSLAMQISMLFLVLNLMETVYLTMASVLGVTVAFLFSALSLLVYITKIHDEFKTGKKIPISVKIANKNALFTILDLNAPLFLASILVAWLSSGILMNFAIPLTIGILLSCFFNLIVFKGLVKMYGFINSSKYNQYGFVKPVEVQVEKQNETTK